MAFTHADGYRLWGQGPWLRQEGEMVWMDDDFPRLTPQGHSAMAYPEFVASQLLPAPFEDGQIRSATSHTLMVTDWINQLEAAGLLDGRDRNMLRQWKEDRYRLPRPKLSIELRMPYLEQRALRRQQEEAAAARAEAASYEGWLRQARDRQEVETEARLLREYPLSYREHVAAWEAEREAERQRRQLELQEQLLREQWAKAEEEERRALEELMERDRQELNQRAMAYVADPINTKFDLSEGEFVHWCEEIATPEAIERMEQALARRGQWERRPAWLRWIVAR